MKLMGFSLNMLSLLGMVLAIGLVVDDAIVVVENVERQLEAGLAPLAAARKAMSEVTGPIIATTAVLMAVFIPVAFIPGVAGRLYNQFALTVAISVGISAFNSLTLSPALSAAFLKHRPEVRFIPFLWFNRGFEWLSHAYARCVRMLIRLRWAMLTIFLAGIGVTYLVSLGIPSTFLPVEDQGYFFVVLQLPDGACTTVFGGMLAATILTLLFVPVFYAVIERLREGPQHRFVSQQQPVQAPRAEAAE
jgi:multidrug efflux pump subunit AcrB